MRSVTNLVISDLTDPNGSNGEKQEFQKTADRARSETPAARVLVISANSCSAVRRLLPPRLNPPHSETSYPPVPYWGVTSDTRTGNIAVHVSRHGGHWRRGG